MRCMSIVALSVVVAAPLGAQRISDARVAYARPTHNPSSSTQRDDTIGAKHNRTAGRIFLGTVVGIPVAFAGGWIGAAMHICITGETADVCEFDFLYAAAAGYVVGSALGAALVEGPRCSGASRVRRAMLGSAVGTLLSLAALAAGGGRTVNAEAIVVTAVTILGPATGAAIALLPCD